jgi:transcription antitermination protein NusB
MTRLELRVVIASFLAATVVLGAVVCAAYGLTIIASALSIYALGVGAWLYHSIERLIMARRISTVRTAAKPLQPLLPVMAALMGLTQAVIRSLGDVTDLPARRWELPVLRWGANFPGNRSSRRVLERDGSENEPHR